MSHSHRLSRREFLTTAATVVAAPAIIPASALGQGAAPPPSERITVGLIGLGKIGMGTHVRGFLSESRVQVVALCDVESQRLQQGKALAEKQYADRLGKGGYKGCDTYGDFRDLVARPDIDGVVIATPDHWHALIAIAAMESGKDVYCEKPMGHSITEARAMAEAARRHGRVFQVGSQQRSDRAFRFACELVRNGRIGKVHTVRVNIGGPPEYCNLPPEPTPPTLDWDMWLGPAPWRPFHHTLCPIPSDGFPPWRSYWEFGGGAMNDWGAHHFDIAQWGLGMDESGPVEVHPPDGKDYTLLTYKYANGVIMTRGDGLKGAATEFIGDNGRVAVNRGQFLVTEPESLKRETFGPGDVRLYDSTSHRGNWLDCMRTRRPTICTADIGYRTATVCHIGNICYLLNRPLRWSPEKERFENDGEANRLLCAFMREPWRV
ncbi:MAG: Gfo/Idh/MocA family oxidoreductase [Candidatus Sumerlaeota bacterium]|nr:Gfo/Idh/MocA family oxidoreductase [Candidatus Sumerlaeota bacterium]